jgi:integrase
LIVSILTKFFPPAFDRRHSELGRIVIDSNGYVMRLRLQEALNLHVADVDSQQMLIHVHRGNDANDRLVPLLEPVDGPLKLPLGFLNRGLNVG